MQTHRSATQTLNYFQQSPVRGRLEPSDGLSRSGWRYLQCTDTPNELRVLLPPRTALIYSFLLKGELQELAQDKGAAWDRIIQIRHLKDRMIRKCQRLAKDSSSIDKNTGRVMLFTVHAPPDFRLKEMERWFRDQGPDFVQKMSNGNSNSTSCGPHCCSKCGPPVLPNPQAHKTLPALADATKAGRAVTRSNSAPTRTPAMTRSRSVSQAVPRPRTPTDTKRSQPRSSSKPPTRAPERVPKRPSNSSEDTAVEEQPQIPPQMHRRVKELIQQQLPTPPTLSRSNSAHSASPPRAPSVSPPPVPPPLLPSPPPIPVVNRVPDIPSIPSIPFDILTPEDSDEDDDDDDLSLLSSVRVPITRASIQSPEPLPIPYRPREWSATPPSEPADAPFALAALEAHTEFPEILRVSSPDSTLIEAGGDPLGQPTEAPTTGRPLETIQERSEGSEASHGRPLVRRRSSLKKRDSMSKLSAASNSKSVTWAMDRDWTDQMSKFVKSTNEAEVSAYELGELRAQYQEEIAMMRIVCHDALVAAEQMGVSTDLLRREAIALAEQENKVVAITDHMERKESHYREKVMNVLEETRRVVQLCDKKRDQQDS
ncbi:hypothetical protein PHLGIDRAFT_129824 [Phlebiopsis gigantea 11061_1 CR5-6]|uniref:Uncharacterized protein n=1 Tax=Phlebiopsis gigantea (strain 11061_1 CR5-6) TaxID=745531 RepID=A0A0C3S680_PHLG1|nr:hypothetical protein PHLGIDRAFT_129824 [Phlebiopsis gigantea 11061_1 CR5-6]